MVDSPERKDPMGYYARLGVPSTATAERIKLAFRQQAKHVHPDHNTGAGAKDAFQRLNEAYQVLSDPVTRAQYDARAQELPPAPASPSSSGPAPSPSGGGAAAGRTRSSRAARPSPGASPGAADKSVAAIACSGCGTVTAQPRYVTYWRVISYGIGTRRQPVQGVFCRSCADRRGLKASLTTWALGWWGVPWGPYWTVKALWQNLKGGEKPGDLNAALLRQQALYFLGASKPALARSALDQAIRLVERPEMRQKLEKMRILLGAGGRESPPDRWRPLASWAFYLHVLLIVGGAVGAWTVVDQLALIAGQALIAASQAPALLPGPALPPPPSRLAATVPSSPPVPAPPPSILWHVSTGTLVLRDGPGAAHAAVGRLYQSDTVELLARIDGWARIKTAGGQTGFVAQQFLAAGAGADDE